MMAALERALVVRVAKGVPNRFTAPAVKGTRADIMDGYIFGGQLVANALAAAAATVPHHFTCHVLHALFVASGDPAEPLEADVALVRDGRSLCNRLVTVSQRRRPVSADGGAAERRTILTLQASFQRASEWRDATGAALSHQQPLCPNVPPPEAVAPVPFIAQRQLIHEHRLVVPPDPTASRGRQAPREAEQMAWMRVSGRLREGSSGLGEECDGVEVAQLPPGEIHKVALAFMSDWGVMDTPLLPHGRVTNSPEGDMLCTSLDHSMHFLRPFQADDYLLHHMVSPSASGGRGLTRGMIYNRAGELVALTSQESLMRNLAKL